MNSRPRPRPLVLCILDGWGERQKADDNAIEIARAPNWHRLKSRWPHAQLQASEHYVGLPDGQMGNSEVGHTNIGAGRLVLQDLPRIDAAIAEGKLASMPALCDFIGKLKASRGTAHLMGLMSPGGVHSPERQPPPPVTPACVPAMVCCSPIFALTGSASSPLLFSTPNSPASRGKSRSRSAPLWASPSTRRSSTHFLRRCSRPRPSTTALA